MLTKTKIALSSALIVGFASAAVAQQSSIDARVAPRVYVSPAPYLYYGVPGVGVVFAPSYDRLQNVDRARDDFTGYSPRNYSDTPGND